MSKQSHQKHDNFRTGDTIAVKIKVREGNRERLQTFQGVVILKKRMKNIENINASFTVRKISYGVGVERVFPYHSPNIVDIQVVQKGDVNQARIYYLRELRGKKARIKQRIDHKQKTSA